MSQEKKYDVFISYSRKDYDEVKAFVDMLKKRIPTIEVWMDLKRITVADEFDEKIISAIDASSYVIFAVSPNSNSIGEGSSKWTKKELVYAKNTDKKVIPVLLNGAKLNSWFLFEFGRTDCIDTKDTPQVEKLIENLSFLTNKPTLEEELRREKERREREAELARKEAELERLRKEKELQERMAQAEAEEQEKEMIEEPDFIESAEILNNESQELSPKPFKKIGLKKILMITVLSLAGIMLMFGTILAIARRTLRYEYDYSNQTATVIQKKPLFDYAGNIKIPELVKHKGGYFQVRYIGDLAFDYCNNLTSITIPNSVTSIGEDAFWNCSGLTTIIVEKGNKRYDSRENCNAIIETATNTLIQGCNSTVIPNSVTSIGKHAFSSCKAWTSITIPNSVTSIGDWTFSGCSGLTSITILNSVTRIGSGAFAYCKGLTSITIPNSVTSIGYNTFAYCSGLTSITIPNSVTSIGCGAFKHCSSLASIIIPNSVTSIGMWAFEGCKGLTSITIPNSVTSIGDGAFEGCKGLTSITIPNSVTSIGDKAFSGCDALKSVKIPKTLTEIGKYAFPSHTQVIRE